MYKYDEYLLYSGICRTGFFSIKTDQSINKMVVDCMFSLMEPVSQERLTREYREELDALQHSNSNSCFSTYLIYPALSFGDVLTVDWTRNIAGNNLQNLEEISSGRKNVDPEIANEECWHLITIKSLPSYLSLYTDIPNKADIEWNDFDPEDVNSQSWNFYLLDATHKEVWACTTKSSKSEIKRCMEALVPLIEGRSLRDVQDWFYNMYKQVMGPYVPPDMLL